MILDKVDFLFAHGNFSYQLPVKIKSALDESFFLSIVNQRTITSDLNDLHTTIQDIRSACQKMPVTAEDRFAVAMSVSFTEVPKTALRYVG